MNVALYRRTSWREVAPEFAVGEVDGNFAGTIEHRDGRYHATTGLGERIGSFRTLEGAQRALERVAETEHVHDYGRRDVALAKAATVLATVAVAAATVGTMAVMLP